MIGRRMRIALILAALLIVAGAATIRICADGGSMGSAYRTCDCRGWEWPLYDRTAADGPRRTLCVGFIRSRRCFQFQGGPEIPCLQSRR
jgi:hypothetical protein